MSISNQYDKYNVFKVDMYQLDKSGKPPNWKIWAARGMIIFALATQIFLILQAAKIFETQNAAGVSLPAFIVYSVSMIFWIIYSGWVLRAINWPLMLSSVLGLLMSILIVIGIAIYN